MPGVMDPGVRRDDQQLGPALLALHRLAFHESLAALHLVGQRRLVDLDHDRVGVDAEVLHQRLRDVAHHAGLLLIGTAGGHAHGNFRHPCLSLCSCYEHSCYEHSCYEHSCNVTLATTLTSSPDE